MGRFDALDPPSAAFAPPESPDPPPEPAESDVLDEPDEPVEPDDAPSPDVELPDSDAAEAFVRDALEVDRSFLAHPEPLKWTAGGTNAFRSVPSAPQTGQNFGPGASMPWMNSVRVEQFEQT